jgi:hypothetical protein
MRNAVQHREMPPFNVSLDRRLDTQSGDTIRDVKVTFPVAWLLDSPKCSATVKRELRNDPEEVLNMADVIDDAMNGFLKVFLSIARINHPESITSVNLLRRIFKEAHPGIPGLIKLRRPLAGARIQNGINFDIHRIDDLLIVVQEAPIGIPYQP